MDDTLSTELKRIIYQAVRGALKELPQPIHVCPKPKLPKSSDTKIPPIMSPAQLAKELDVSVRTLERWRAAGTGPAFDHPNGTRIYRYRRENVLAWLSDTQIP